MKGDFLDLIQLKEGGFETDFEKHMKAKQAMEDAISQRMENKIEEEKRRQRCTMTIEELLKTEIYDAVDERRKKEREELARFMDTRAG